MVKQNGIRDGVKKEDILNLTTEEKALVLLRRDIENVYVKNEDAHSCAVRSDQMYQQYLDVRSTVMALTFNVLSAKTKIEHNMQDIIKKSTDRVYPNTLNKMTIRDLEIENMHTKRLMLQSKVNLWTAMMTLYRYVGLTRVDKKVFFTEEDYNGIVGWTKTEFKKNNVELYDER